RAILSQPYNDRPACTYCGFCQAFGCHVGAKSSILITKLPEADATGNFKLITGAMCHRVNRDDRGRVTGVGYYGPDGSDNTIEADLVILTTFIYDNTRLLLLSKTDKFPNGLANSSGQVGKHLTAHMMPNVYALFDDRHVNNYMGPSAQKHTIDDFNADNRSRRHGLHPRLANPARPRQSAGRANRPHHHGGAARHAALGCGLSRLPGEVLYAAGGDGRANGESALRRPNDRPRPRRERCVGLARAASDLRLATAERALARRVHDEEDGGDRALH